jgi:hypothetical protein
VTEDFYRGINDLEPRGRPDHLPVTVDIKTLPGNTQRLDYGVQHDVWFVSGTARMMSGQLALTSLRLEFNPIGADDGALTDLPVSDRLAGGISTEILRAIPVGKIRASIQREVLAQEGFDILQVELRRSPAVGAHRKAAAEAVRGRKLGRGRPRLTDEFLREVAVVALQIQAEGVPKGGLRQAVGERFGNATAATVRDWFSRCREIGFLSQTHQGQRGVMPGQRLYDQETDAKRIGSKPRNNKGTMA